MGFFSELKKRTMSKTSENFLTAWLGSDEFDDFCQTNNYIKFDTYPDVKTCIKIYADLISSMTIHLMENTEYGDKRIHNALSRFLDIEPYKYTTRKTLIYKTVEELMLTGNSILLPVYRHGEDTNYLEQLVPTSQSDVMYNKLEDGGYDIKHGNKIYRHDEIIHFVNNPNFAQPWYGESYKVYINDILLNLQQGQKIKSDYYTKHFKPKIVFLFNADADVSSSKEKRDELYEKWIDTKPGQPYILPGALVDFKHFPAMSLADIALDSNTKIDKLAVANIFGVPGFMVGIGDFNKEEYNNFINTRINPIVKEMQQEMTQKLIISPNMYIKFNIDSLKVFDTDTRNQFLLSGKSLGIFSANEIRIETGYEPIDKPEMNEYSMLENYIPINKIGEQNKLTGGD